MKVGEPIYRLLNPGDEITVFKSLGNAVQDLVLARRLIARAEEAGIGFVFDHR